MQVVPMLNIDGVVEGNKRCNIRGRTRVISGIYVLVAMIFDV